MKFPCPHCGSNESFYDRSADEFKSIVPLELANEYKFESPSSSTTRISTSTKGTIDFAIESRIKNLERTIIAMENEIKILSYDMKKILKSQKVSESILTNMNKKILKLQKE